MKNLIQLMADDPQTFALVGLGLLSLVLPLMAGAKSSADRVSCARTVWTGTILMGVCALLIKVFPRLAVIGFALAVVLCALFAHKLRRQTRPATKNG